MLRSLFFFYFFLKFLMLRSLNLINLHTMYVHIQACTHIYINIYSVRFEAILQGIIVLED